MKTTKIINISFLLAFLSYLVLCFYDIREIFFNPNYAGNDARQQLFPLYSVIHPGIFENDLIFKAMKAYVAPLHWYIASFFTLITTSPVLAGHSVMLLQLGLAFLGVFIAVRTWAASSAAFFSLIWILHTASLFKNTVGGLPRGWAGAVVGCYLWFISKENHLAIICCLVVGCLLHPPSTFLVAVCYSLHLAYSLLRRDTRNKTIKPAIMFALASPVIFFIASQAVSRPAEIGKMITLQEASKEPALNKNGGRFPFFPLKQPMQEIKPATLRPFLNEQTPSKENGLMLSVLGCALLLVVYQIVSKRVIIPEALGTFFAGIFLAYFAARFFAFRLYVPSRYLGWPFSLFIIVFFSVGIWKLLADKTEKILKPAAALVVCGLIIYFLSGSGLTFKRSNIAGTIKQEEFLSWIKNNTAETALIAGHPTLVDGVPLYAMRRTYVTTETAHPFYDKYWQEISRRLDNSFLLLYASDPQEFLKIAHAEKIDYFVFSARYFALKNATYFKPQDRLVQKLASRPSDQYFLKNLLEKKVSYLPFHFGEYYILDVNALAANVDMPNQ